MADVITLDPKDTERKKLQREGSRVYVEFFRAPGVEFADARVDDWPDDLSYEEMSMWLRQFANEIDIIAACEEIQSEQAGQE